MTRTRPIRAEISRRRLVKNYRTLRRRAGAATELLAVVKANAYGHGLAECAPLLAEAGAAWFGVTCVEEGVALRKVCPGARILAMSGLWPGEAEAVLEHGLTPAVWEPSHLDLLEQAAERRGATAVPVHLEIDTGMSRQGVQRQHLPALLERFGPGSRLRMEGVMTHFHSAEDADATGAQTREFVAAVEAIAARGLRPEILSAGNSANALQQDTVPVTEAAERMGARRMVRAGIGLYGYAPWAGCAGAAGLELEPVMAWKTQVTAVREVEAGATAGYDATFRAVRRTRLALLPVGYADGLNRLLSNRGWALVRGQRAPFAGRVSMDQTMVDVTEIAGAAAGDEVVLIGEQGGERITAADVAALTGTIPYEVLCAVAARVPRVMVD